MKTAIFLFVLGLSCLLSLVQAQCDLRGKKQDVNFPDITEHTADSYIMGVEYSEPGADETEYYTEYYDSLFKKGRVDSHYEDQNHVYIYYYETWESWTIIDDICAYNNVSVVPELLGKFQTDWLHGKGENTSTIGPSAMFKKGLDVWKNGDRTKMAYMGQSDMRVRGELAVYWRRCLSTDTFVDYYFADPTEYNAFDSEDSSDYTPLRVVFNNITQEVALSVQVYDILSFQRVIPAGVEPFQLKKGMNCKRGPLFEGPDPPDFSGKSLLFSAEVLYQRLNKDKRVMSSYYSTLMYAKDIESDHVAYYYSPWNTTKPDSEIKKPFAGAPEYVIFDDRTKYAYTINLATAKCEISRPERFIPRYQLPEKGGSLALTSPYGLFAHKEMSFLTDGTDRGIPVSIFEAETTDFILDDDNVIPRAIISHSYLKADEELENAVSVRYAPTQMQFRFFRKEGEEEVLTMNIFGFTTKIPNRRYLFDVRRCFKNDDDYLFLSIGLEIPSQFLPKIESALPEIERNVFSEVTMYSDLNPVRAPVVMTDLKGNFVYVTMVVLGKPTLKLDFMDSDKEKGKKIKSEDEGPADFDYCAQKCLEDKAECWGFSLCGAFCNYGSTSDTTVVDDAKCELYKRFSNKTLYSKEFEVNNVVKRVKSGEFRIVAFLPGNREPISLVATVVDVTDPAEDDSLFEKMGHYLDSRMRVLKAAKRLKKGSTVKNLGRLRYDECQSVCLDFKDCETLSYCLKNSECITSDKYGSDLTDGDMEANDFCVLLARRYVDHFERTPGVFVESKSGTVKTVNNVEECARACLQEGQTGCLSFDHCSLGEKKECILYKVHYLNPNDRKAAVKGQDPSCGHYTRKYSTEFKKKVETVITDASSIPPIRNLTLEECAKTCVDYGEGTCFGYDFCQDKTLYSTSCTLYDKDPSRMKTSYSSVCTNYVRSAQEYAPHPFTNSYAGGIGFLCFLVGGIIGAAIVFGIAYYRANRAG